MEILNLRKSAEICVQVLKCLEGNGENGKRKLKIPTLHLYSVCDTGNRRNERTGNRRSKRTSSDPPSRRRGLLGAQKGRRTSPNLGAPSSCWRMSGRSLARRKLGRLRLTNLRRSLRVALQLVLPWLSARAEQNALQHLFQGG